MDLHAQLTQVVGPGELDMWDGDAGGNLPRVAPNNIDEAVECLRLAHSNGLAVIPEGLGSRRTWTHQPKRADFVLSTRNMRGVLSYEPGDGTLSALAGTTCAELEQCVALGGHRLTPDLPRPQAGTIGGAVASGHSGFDRLRVGPLRHHILGVRALLGDGTLAKSGGQLVKNVTGYDMHRLYCGSFGSLCLLVEINLRLFPAPEEWAAVEFHAESRAQAAQAALDLEEMRLPLDAVLIQSPTDTSVRWTVLAFLSGRRAVIDVECDRVHSSLSDSNVKLEMQRGTEARSKREQCRDLEWDEQAGWAHLRLGVHPTGLPALLEQLDTCFAGSVAQFSIQPLIAEVQVRFEEPLTDTQAVAVHDRLLASGLNFHWRAAPDSLRSQGDIFGSAPTGIALMQRLQSTLDPQSVFARGRYLTGL